MTHIQTINDIQDLVTAIYNDNWEHLDFLEAMNGGDCDCIIHNTLNTIVKYAMDEETE